MYIFKIPKKFQAFTSNHLYPFLRFNLFSTATFLYFFQQLYLMKSFKSILEVISQRSANDRTWGDGEEGSFSLP